MCSIGNLAAHNVRGGGERRSNYKPCCDVGALGNIGAGRMKPIFTRRVDDDQPAVPGVTVAIATALLSGISGAVHPQASYHMKFEGFGPEQCGTPNGGVDSSNDSDCLKHDASRNGGSKIRTTKFYPPALSSAGVLENNDALTEILAQNVRERGVEFAKSSAIHMKKQNNSTLESPGSL